MKASYFGEIRVESVTNRFFSFLSQFPLHYIPEAQYFLIKKHVLTPAHVNLQYPKTKIIGSMNGCSILGNKEVRMVFSKGIIHEKKR